MPLSISILQPVDDSEYAKNIGWIQYRDSEYTESSPLSIEAGVWQPLPNNADSVIDAYGPDGISLYDGQKITPDGVGDGINITVNFKAKSSQVKTACEFAIDIGGTQGRIFPRTFTCPDSAGTSKPISFSFSGYTLDTWKANGGEMQVKAEHEMFIYDISVIIGIYSKA